ncbi:hypothetical protein KA107_00405 [Candidatus Pacearchaeota archaeon]|nr:hypothetical protein [Candidatus Pacearchaeota archaeon]
MEELTRLREEIADSRALESFLAERCTTRLKFDEVTINLSAVHPPEPPKYPIN